jgi:hypothetical protein
MADKMPGLATAFGDVFLEAVNGYWILDTIEGAHSPMGKRCCAASRGQHARGAAAASDGRLGQRSRDRGHGTNAEPGVGVQGPAGARRPDRRRES